MADPLTTEVYSSLTRQLRRRALRGRGRVPLEDVEDVVADAIARVALERPNPRVSWARRGARSLDRAVADYWRRRDRAKEIPRSSLMSIDDLPPDVATVQIDALENLRIDDLIRVLGVAGHDVVAYARLRMLDFTDAEIAGQLGWSLRDVGAVRKRLSRIGPRIARLIEPN